MQERGPTRKHAPSKMTQFWVSNISPPFGPIIWPLVYKEKRNRYQFHMVVISPIGAVTARIWGTSVYVPKLARGAKPGVQWGTPQMVRSRNLRGGQNTSQAHLGNKAQTYIRIFHGDNNDCVIATKVVHFRYFCTLDPPFFPFFFLPMSKSKNHSSTTRFFGV